MLQALCLLFLKKIFNKGAITNPIGLISGKIAGVQITTNSGAPGEAATIRIRGGSSLNANNDPLIVIDGVVTSGEGGSGSRSALNALNPADIESFYSLERCISYRNLWFSCI